MVKKRRFISLLMLVGALTFSANASTGLEPIKQDAPMPQDGTLSGVISDSYGSLIGATVVIKGTTKGVITDFDGKFVLEGVKNGDIIQCSFIGYKTLEVTYTGQSNIILTMVEDAEMLGEVVVTALGIKREKKALGYAQQEIKGDALLQTREANVANALSGKVAGLQVLKSSNGPGGSSKIVLRGNSSLTGSNQPLIVVDGTPMDNFTGGVDGVWGGTDTGNGLADINPDDIESMSVLKGASAAALYGSRAGNGVILITTKSGRKQSGLGITLSAGVSIETIFMQPDFQADFGQGGTGIFNNTSGQSWGAKADGTSYVAWDGVDTPLQTYDNVGNYFQTGLSINEGITLQQSYDGTSIFASINRSENEGVVPGADIAKTSITLRGTSEFGDNKRWRFDAKATYLSHEANNRPLQGISPTSSFNTIYTLPRSIDITSLENSVDANNQMIWWDAGKSPQENPYWMETHRTNQDTRNRLLGSMALSYKITDWWSLELRGGTDYYNTLTINKTYAGGAVAPKGNYSEATETFYENNYNFLTSFKEDNIVDRLGGLLTLGGNLMHQNRRKMAASTGDLLIPDMFSLSNGVSKDNLSASSSNVTRKMNSLYGTLQLNWDGWLFVDVTGRNDWSSTMSKANRSFFYPSVSMSGVVSDMIEKMGGSLPDWMTFAKVRASYAEVGNDLSPYQLETVYSMGKDPNGNPVATPGSVLYDPNVKSESIKSWEAGFDVKFFSNRLGLDVAWYKSNATNQLLNLPMDPFTGYSSKKINAGDIENQGMEFMLYGTIIENDKGFNWESTINASFNRNKIIDLHDDIEEFGLATFDDLKIVARTGGLYGDIYGKKYQRVEEGEHAGKMIVDANGLPVVTSDQHLLGNQQPDFMIGWSNSFKYKNLSFSFLIDGRFGGEIYSATTGILYKNGSAAGTVVNGERNDFIVPNTVMADGDGFKANDVAVTPQKYWERAAGSNIGVGEQFLYDATNIRLRNVSLAYDLKKSWFVNTPIQGVKLSFVCNNVLMLSYDLEGIDPESVSATHTNANGFEMFSAPTSRSYVFNVAIKF